MDGLASGLTKKSHLDIICVTEDMPNDPAGNAGGRSDWASDARQLLEQIDRLLKTQLGMQQQRDNVRTAQIAEEIYRFRKRRDLLFEQQAFGHLFGEPAWDMLLDLYIARVKGVQISVTSLCIAGSVPTTTGLRWIQLLVRSGLARRHADESDARRTFVEITDEGYRMLEMILSGCSWPSMKP